MIIIKTIFIIDDDINIGNMLEELLTKENYAVCRAISGIEALMKLKKCRPDLVLLDLMLPELSGEQLLPYIKDIPVIIVSSKTDVDDKVSTLLNGATDYVTKPFDTKELLARIAVHLRNTKNKTIDNTDHLVFEDIVLDTAAYTVMVANQPVKLTRTEYAILRLLMERPSQVITKSALLDHISEYTPDCVETSLKVHISNLRKKLRAVNGNDYIESVWGIGFKMRENKLVS